MTTTKQATDQSFFVYVKDTVTGKIKKLVVPSGLQVGLKGSPSELQVLGRLAVSSKTLTTTAKNYGIISVGDNDTLANVVLSYVPVSSVINVSLPDRPKEGQLHFIKDASNTANTVSISITSPVGALIDGAANYSIVDAGACVGLHYHEGSWRVFATAGVSSGGGGGAPTDATYLTLSNNVSLTNERRLTTSGSNLTLTDNGANSTVALNLTAILGGGAGTFTYSTITVDQYGRVTAASSGAAPPGATAEYITVSNDGSLANERALAVGSGLRLTDGGANSNITVGINNNILATVSGTNFSGPVIATGGLTGSLQQTVGGVSYLVAGANITITSQSNGQVIISAASSGGGSGNTVWLDGGHRALSTGSISIDSLGRYADQIGADTFFFVSGTIDLTGTAARRAVFGGDVKVSGSVNVTNDVVFSDTGTRIERVGSDMLFYDAANPLGFTLTQLALTGSGGSSGSFDPSQSVITSASFINVTPTFTNQVFAVSLQTSGTQLTTSGTILYSTTLADNQFLDFEAEVIGANMRGYRRSKMQRAFMRFSGSANMLSSSQQRTELLTNFRGIDNEPSIAWSENIRFMTSGSTTSAQLEVTGSGIIDWSAYISLNRQQTFATSASGSLPEGPLIYSQYLLAWYRSDNILTNGSNVTSVLDKTGNGRHLGQTTTSLQPTLEVATSTFNGWNTWNTDGSTQYLSGTIWNLSEATQVGYTIFTVFMNTSAAGSWAVWDLSPTTLTNTYAHHIFNTAPQVRYAGGQVMSWTLTPSEDFATYVTINIATGSSERSETWVKGVSVATTSTTPSGLKPLNIRVGRLFQDVFPFPAKYAELIICSGSLPVAGRQAIEAYLAQRYNIV